jgi:uncharacterized protein YfaS (alpha-2-macroglobulin family)
MRLQLFLVLLVTMAAAAVVTLPRDPEPPPLLVVAVPTPTPWPGIDLSVKEVADVGPARDENLAEGRPLDSATVAALLAALPPLPIPIVPAIVRKTAGPPPPPARAVVPAIPATPRLPLRVLRHATDARISVTFSQPMGTLTSLAATAQQEIPVRVTPALPPGKWTWKGTSTLAFEPGGPLPLSTRYTVEVPRGTKSADGSVLRERVRWSFDTPTVRCREVAPHEALGPLSPMVLVFDQPVDPRDLVPRLQFVSKKGTIGAHMGTGPDHEQLSKTVKSAREAGRFPIVVRPAERLGLGTHFSLQIAPGLHSLAGPLVTREVQNLPLSTYGPLVILGKRREGDRLVLRCANPLDPSRVRALAAPDVPDAKTTVEGADLVLEGAFLDEMEYTVRVARAVDQHGQSLRGKDQVVFPPRGTRAESLEVEDEGESFYNAPDGRLTVTTAGMSAFQVTARPASPGLWPGFDPSNVARWPVRPIGTRRVTVHGPHTSIDLRAWLRASGQHLVVTLSSLRKGGPTRTVWVRGTDIHLDVDADRRFVYVWATTEKEGRPIPHARVTLGSSSAVTDGSGLARLPLPKLEADLLVVDVHGVRDFYPWRDQTWRAIPKRATGWWHVFDDRGTYRPGETAHVKGLLRMRPDGPHSALQVPPRGTRYDWALRDARNRLVARGHGSTDGSGGLDLVLRLPRSMATGTARLSLYALRQPCSHEIAVAEFRRPEFEVTAGSTVARAVRGEGGDVWVTGRYYSGGSIAGAPVRWSFSASPTAYAPPGFEAYTFGASSGSIVGTAALQGRADASGRDRVRVDVPRLWPPTPVLVTAHASMEDVSRQAWTADTTLLVHPSSVYVGLSCESPYVPAGQPFSMRVVTCDVEGRPVPGRLVSLMVYPSQEPTWTKPVLVRGVLSSAHPDRVDLRLPTTGQYDVVALVADARGRQNVTTMPLWSAGDEAPPGGQLVVLPDRARYVPGETAHLLVQSGVASGRGELLVQADDVLLTRVFDLQRGRATVDVPIDERAVRALTCLVRVRGRDARGRTVDQRAWQVLSVPPERDRLAVEVEAKPSAVEPGEEARIDVRVRDSRGRPVRGEFALVVADDAVLSLSGYQMGDPLDDFFPRSGFGGNPFTGLTGFSGQPFRVVGSNRSLGGTVYPNRPWAAGSGWGGPFPRSIGGINGGGAVFLNEFTPRMQTPGMATTSDGRPSDRAMDSGAEFVAYRVVPRFYLRVNYAPLALFAPRVLTDSNGRATVCFKTPDNLTRYRVMAVAASGARQFGTGQTSLTVRKPLAARVSAPRFLRLGDRFELPVVLQNQTDAPMVVRVASRAQGLEVEEAGREVAVPANDRVEIRFPCKASSVGDAVIQVCASTPDGKRSDAAQTRVPVLVPATRETVAVYGHLDKGAVRHRIEKAKDMLEGQATIDVSASTSLLQSLSDALLYIVRYPHECGEQVSSRVLAVAALRDVLGRLHPAGLPSEKTLVESMGKDVLKLRSLQNEDGGFSLWQKGSLEWPFLSVHVTHALVRASRKGYAVPREVLVSAMRYLRGISGRFDRSVPVQERVSTVAYALYVRHLTGEDDEAQARRLVDRLGLHRTPTEALGWLLSVVSRHDAPFADRLARELAGRVDEDASTAHVTSAYDDGGSSIFASSRRTDAVVLDALMQHDPGSTLIPKLVRGLLGARVNGLWESTQEDVFVLLALDRYVHAYERETPDLVARIWLGDDYLGARHLKGRQAAQRLSRPGECGDVVLEKRGSGRLYYRVALTYATSGAAGPTDHGFAVERVYEPIDHDDDVSRDADGTWRIKPGARVRVRVTVRVPAERHHVALVDPLAAGLEPIDGALRGSDARDAIVSEWDYESLRDDRTEAFRSQLTEGTHEYVYQVRATTPGRFLAPAPHVEDLYHAEVFGRGAPAEVEVRKEPSTDCQ